MTSSVDDLLSINDVLTSIPTKRKANTYDKYGIQYAVPRQVYYLNGTPTSMWLQLGNITCIEKMQKHLNELTITPLSSGFNIKPQVSVYVSNEEH